MKFSKYIRDKQFAMIAGFLFWVVLLMTLFLFQLDREVMIMLTVLFIIFMMKVSYEVTGLPITMGKKFHDSPFSKFVCVKTHMSELFFIFLNKKV